MLSRKISVDKKVELTPDFSVVDPHNQLRLDGDGTGAGAGVDPKLR